MDSNFLRAMNRFFEIYIKGTKEQTPDCESVINHYTFYQMCLVPAVALTLLMACTKRRRELFLDFLNGRPGLIYPMDTLTSSSRISYCCAFGATGFLVYQILLEQKFAIDYTGPIALKTLIAVVSMFVYGLVFFPVFACLAMRTAFSYALGTLYVWVFLCVNSYQLTECTYTTYERSIRVVRALPSLACLGYLSVSLPLRFCIACYRGRYFWSPSVEDSYSENVENIKESFQGRHVCRLFRKKAVIKEPEGMLNKVKAALIGLAQTWIYRRHRGFRYPSRFMSVMFTGGFVVYMITVEFLTSCLHIANYILGVLTIQLDAIAWESQPGDGPAKNWYRTGLLVGYYSTYIIKVSMCVSMAVACTITVLGILHMMTSFRRNLFAMYRGDYSDIPPPSRTDAASLCVGSIKFAGFQVAYIVWGYIVQVIVLFVICIILATIICMLMAGITDWLTDKVLQLWPSVVIAIVFMVGQKLLAKYVFLQTPGNHLRLNNRRFFFIFTFFMFFYNIFIGLFSCLLRILKAIGLGTLNLARLDNSTLPRKYEFFDPGFSAYQGYIHLEAAHTHPVVNVFIRLLVALSKSRQDKTQGMHRSSWTKEHCDMSIMSGGVYISGLPRARTVNIAARFNWHVVYTLLHNPAIRIHRRGYAQGLQKARQKGLKIPISDKPITDIDLVQLQEDNDREREFGTVLFNNNSVYLSFTNFSQNMATVLTLPFESEINEKTNESKAGDSKAQSHDGATRPQSPVSGSQPEHNNSCSQSQFNNNDVKVY